MRKFILLILFPMLSNSQKLEDLKLVLDKTNHSVLLNLHNSYNEEYVIRKKRIENFLKTNNQLSAKIHDNGIEKEIYDIDESGVPVYLETTNSNSAITSRVTDLYSGGSLGLNLHGQNMKVGVWDSGPVQDSHVEFTDFKVSNIDFNTTSDHGTHVLGTILAAGVNPLARGIAFEASGESYDWNNDFSEMAIAASSGLLVSNHSYGNSNNPEWLFGAYDLRAKQLDEITFAAPYYLPIAAAGNDRNKTTDTQIGPQLSSKFGYDLTKGMQNAKNFLTVAAVNNVSNYLDASSVVMSSFSSWGPSDDGRIKPDVSAKGVSVFSTTFISDLSNNSYGSKNGTSMAAPAVSGSAILLQQHYHNLFNDYMRSATLKGIILHTADEAGYYDGPDYEYGWGLVNTKKAAILISNRSSENSIVEELSMINENSYTKMIYSNGIDPLTVSISWTDRAHPNHNTGVVDPNVNYLVNDLDVKVSKSNDVFFPWSLNKAQPYDAATKTKTNDVDNFERVDVINAQGVYVITVSHKGTLVGGLQDFSLIVSGVEQSSLSTDSFTNNNVGVYPNPSHDYLFLNNKQDIFNVRLFDLNGRLVKNISSFLNAGENKIDVSDLNSGMYILKYIDDEKEYNSKILKN